RGDVEKIGGWGAQDTVLISRKPFSTADIERLRSQLPAAHLQSIFMPGDSSSNAFGELLHSSHPDEFYSKYAYDVSPVPDDRPFFFYTVQPRDLWNFVTNANSASADYKINRAVPLLFSLMGISVVATALILVLPRALLRTQLPKQKGVVSFLWYFLCL